MATIANKFFIFRTVLQITKLQRTNVIHKALLLSRRLNPDAGIKRHLTCKLSSSSTNDSLKIEWKNGDYSLYPYIFLRDNCQCENCYHATAKQRKVSIVESVPVHIKPDSFWASENEVNLKWEDGHQSRFSSKWLKDRMFPKTEEDVISKSDCGLVPARWGSELAENIPVYDFDLAMKDDKVFLSWLESIAVTGFTVLENTPTTIDSLYAIKNKLKCAFRSTHYGETFVVKNKPAPNNLAYTAGYLPLHTDLPFYRYQPGIQILHCIQQADGVGGENHFVDGFKVAEDLRCLDSEAFQTLSSVKMMFEDVGVDKYGDFCKKFERPVIGLDNFGRVESIAHNNHVRCSFVNAPAGTVKKVYAAFYEIVKIMYKPENLVTYKQKSGDLVAFNNKRVLHGRAAYQATSPRHLQGCYFDWDEVYSAIRVLRQGVGYEEVD